MLKITQGIILIYAGTGRLAGWPALYPAQAGKLLGSPQGMLFSLPWDKMQQISFDLKWKALVI